MNQGSNREPYSRAVLEEILRLGGQGVLTPHDIPGLRRQMLQVLHLMSDGSWYTNADVRAATGGAEQADRRRRELRDLGFVIQRRRRPNSRTWEYRLRLPPEDDYFGTVPAGLSDPPGTLDDGANLWA